MTTNTDINNSTNNLVIFHYSKEISQEDLINQKAFLEKKSGISKFCKNNQLCHRRPCSC